MSARLGRIIVSNSGDPFWSRIVSPDRAASVVRRLMQPDMWSDWGIRTLSADNPAHNPFSYQNGSVWPHDNGIIAMGCSLYGFVKEAAMSARDISEAASYLAFYRLPALYGGIRREPDSSGQRLVGKNGDWRIRNYEDQSQKLCLGILSPTCSALAGLECSTNVVFFHCEKLFSRAR